MATGSSSKIPWHDRAVANVKLHIEKIIHAKCRAINGVRVAELLKTKVPDFAKFQKILRFVKCWAKRRAIYSNVVGYLGGISWAICVVYFCKRFRECPLVARDDF